MIFHTWGRSFLLRRTLCSTVSGMECTETVLWANTHWWPSAAVKTRSAGSLRSISFSPGSYLSHQSALCCISSLRTIMFATVNHLQVTTNRIVTLFYKTPIALCQLYGLKLWYTFANKVKTYSIQTNSSIIWVIDSSHCFESKKTDFLK